MTKNIRPEKKSHSSFGCASGLFSKNVVRIFCFLILLLLICSAVFFAYKKLSAVRVERKTAAVMQSLEKCQELSVIKSRYSDIVTIKKSRIAGLAKSFSIIKYSCIIRVGFSDMSQAKVAVSSSGRGVVVKLPPCEILGNDISEIEVFDESRSIFVPITAAEIVSLINENRDKTEKQLVSEGLLEEALGQAKEILTFALLNLGFESVTVR